MKKILLFILCFVTTFSLACTHFRVRAQDGSVIVGRSLEFGPDLQTQIYTVNRDTQFINPTPDNKTGFGWRALYGYIVLNGFHLFAVSGVNEKGLSYDLLYFPGQAQYEQYNPTNAAHAMPYYALGDYLLGNFSDVGQIKQALPQLNIYSKAVQHAGQAIVFPVHVIVTDATGKSIVVELTNGQLHIYDSPTGLLTNSPDYPWQIMNLNNFVNFLPNAPTPIKKDGITYNSTGQGGGAVGLPGDFTPPSRFVRTAFLMNYALPVKTATEAVNLAEHILNGVDIALGDVRGPVGDTSLDDMDKTEWVVVKDLTHKVLYFRSYSDLTLQKIDLTKLNFASNAPVLNIPIADNQDRIVDATARFLQAKSTNH